MKKLLAHIPRLNRKQRVARNVVCILLLIVVCWWGVGAPLPLRWEFRRAEQKILAGPSEILAVAQGENLHLPETPVELEEYRKTYRRSRMIEEFRETKHVIVGEQGEVLVWFFDSGVFGTTYWAREKTGDMTLWSIYTSASASNETGERISTLDGEVVILQTDLPGAQHATLEWRGYVGGWNGTDYCTNWCSGTGTVQGDGVFIIPVFQSSDPVVDNEGINGRFDLNEAHLVLTDENGTVIYDEVLIVED